MYLSKSVIKFHLLTISQFSLAYAELYIVIAALALRIYPHMSLYKTTLKDIEYDHDQLISMPVSGSKGVWVRMDPMKERSI